MGSGIIRSSPGDAARAAQAAAQAAAAREAAQTSAPSAPVQAQQSAPAPKSDFFSGITKNIFEAIKSNLPSLKDLGQKLINDPAVKQALGDKDPSKIIDAARDFAKTKINEKLANTEFKLPKGEKSWDSGKNLPEGMNSKSFVEKGLQGPGSLGISPTKSGSKEVTLSDSQKSAVDKAGAGLGKIQDGFAAAGKLADLAKKAGIDIPKYEKSAEAGTTKNLYTSQDGKGTVDLNANAKGSFSAGVDGLKAQGEAKVGVTAQRSDGVKTEGKYGTAEANYTATAQAGASAKGSATLDANGLNATARVEAGVSAKIQGEAKVESKPIGGVPGLTAYAGVKAEVEVGANAYAEGKVQIGGKPPKAIATGEAGAFAGARAKVEARAGIGPVGVKGQAEGWVGVGATASGTIGYENGKLKLGGSLGAALGYGGKLGFEVELDVGKAAQIAGHVVDKVADGAKKLADADGDGKLSLNDAKVAAQNVAKTATKVATAAVDTAKNVASAAVDTAKNVASTVSNAASSAASKLKSLLPKMPSIF